MTNRNSPTVAGAAPELLLIERTGFPSIVREDDTSRRGQFKERPADCQAEQFIIRQ